MKEKLILYSKLLLKYLVILLIFLVYIFIWLFCLSYDTCVVYAAESIDNETVINDLKQDESFTIEDYPSNNNDFGLYVIQLQETKEDELALYVYQPSNNFVNLIATKISLSYGFSSNGAGLEPHIYDLELVSTNGTLDKYIIKDYTVPGDAHRYYNLVEIFRKYNELLDSDELDEGGYTSDVAIAVGQQWYFVEVNNVKKCEMNTFNTLDIETIFCGNFTFSNGNILGVFSSAFGYGDCWFLCFNCDDYVIQHIYDGDVSFNQTYVEETSSITGVDIEKGEPVHKELYLSDEDVMTYKGDGLGAKSISWKRILSSSDFINAAEDNDANISDDVKNKILSSQWVFTFTETERSKVGTVAVVSTYYDITEVGILRLHFMDINGTYDLGVVNSLFNPDNISDGYIGDKSIKDLLNSLTDWFEKLFAILGTVILVLVLVAISGFITPVWNIICLVGKSLWFVISLPFRLIIWAFKKGN